MRCSNVWDGGPAVNSDRVAAAMDASDRVRSERRWRTPRPVNDEKSVPGSAGTQRSAGCFATTLRRTSATAAGPDDGWTEAGEFDDAALVPSR